MLKEGSAGPELQISHGNGNEGIDNTNAETSSGRERRRGQDYF